MEKVENIQKYNRKCIEAPLKDFCYLVEDNSSFIEISEWYNGLGVDINIADNYNKHISLTYGELKAIETLTKLL